MALSVIGIIVFFIWGCPLLRFLFIRLYFAAWLFFKATIYDEFKYCYKSIFSIFKNTEGRFSDLLIYYNGTFYIIKLCGFLRKRSDVVVLSNNSWQINSKMIPLVPFMNPIENISYRRISFDLINEKDQFESEIWNLSHITEVKCIILLLPKPRDFGIHVEKRTEWFNSGDLYRGDIVSTLRYFRELIRESREPREKNILLEDAQWVIIKKEYKQIKCN